MGYKEIANFPKMTDNIIFFTTFIFAICSQVSSRYSVRSLGIKVLNDKTFDRHMLKVKDLNPKKIHFFKFFRKKHATKKSGNINYQ
jgi:hypothetical protein